MRVLVTGAGGYIGSLVTEQLIAQGHSVLGIDNLSNGHREAIHPAATFVEGDLLDAELLRALLAKEPVDAVCHLAAEALIGVSNVDPGRSFRVNVCGGLNLLDAMLVNGVDRLVFSSTAAVYGVPDHTPIEEHDRLAPVNAYGESKLAFERMLPWYHKSHGLRYICFRYFNVCGATLRCGEDRSEETHIIPVAFEVVEGRRPYLELFGTDYNTPDGTCVRDYIHVADVAQAHVLALEQIERLRSRAYNVGNGMGYSNRQVLDAVGHVTGKDVNVNSVARRAGDPDLLVASSAAIQRDLGWRPEFPDLESMVESAWTWRQEHPAGYAE